MAPPEESLGVQRVPQSDASFERSSDLLVDVEQSLGCKSITFQNRMIAFAYLSHGGTYKARDLIAKKWPPHSAGAINRISDDVLSLMVRHANGRCRC